MTDILITNPDVITLDEDGSVLHAADVAISGDRILSVGSTPTGFKPTEVIDATDRVVMPGFFNAHTHSPMTFVRGWAEDLPLDRWFNERIWVAESALTAEDVRWGAYLAAAEMIRSGTVGFADHYFYMDEVAKVVEESGLRASLAWCVFGLDSEIGEGLEGSIAFLEQWQGAAGGRIRTVLGPHAPYTCPPGFLVRVAEKAAELGVGLHIHLAESQEQMDSSFSTHGVTPVGLLHRLGLFRQPVIAAHCIHVTDDDLSIMAEYGVTAVQCPNCHMKLAMGVTPVSDMLSLGVNVALGTDGVASNNALDMLSEARLASLMQKNLTEDATVLPGDTPLRLATQNGARAMGFAESGIIAKGHPADLIILDTRRPWWRPRHNLVANLLYAAKAGDVTDVIVAGTVLMRGGALTTLDEDRILYEAERRAFRMVGQDLRTVREYRA
jgi:5-methylthioadenosine/S-adenosylhomocysteine deaminase